RSIVHVLSSEVFGRSLALSEFPVRKEVRGLGMSDWDPYAQGLARAFSYVNTFYDAEPRLDIRDSTVGGYGPVDFVVSTDVFEHVAPPVSVAFQNTRALLTTGGVLVFSVPFVIEDVDTDEHFPNLHEFKVIETSSGIKLVNTTRDGRIEEYTDL